MGVLDPSQNWLFVENMCGARTENRSYNNRGTAGQQRGKGPGEWLYARRDVGTRHAGRVWVSGLIGSTLSRFA